MSLRYGFDAAGNLTLLRQADKNHKLAQYGYDGLNRLTQVMDGPTGTPIETYAYDATGNRTALTNAGNTTAYSYPIDSHRLASVGGQNRTYDAGGNTLTIGGNGRRFVYDNSGRMTQVKAGGIVMRQYQYNAKGEQARAYLDADNTYFVHDEAGHLLGEYDSNGSPTQQILWFGDLPVGVLQGAGASQQLHYIEPDHLGTPRVIIDGQRNVAIWEWSITGEAFGNSPPNQDPDHDGQAFTFDLRFPGQRYDAATGLNYNYFRDYDPATGRYVQSDPIGLNGGISTYGYVDQAPLMAGDFYGLVHWKGKTFTVGAAVFIGGSVSYYDLTSDCIKGRRAKVKVVGIGPSLGIEIRTKLRMPVVGGTGSLIDFDDQWDDLYPEYVFNGLYTNFGFGGAYGIGGDCSVHALGINLKNMPFGDGAQSGGCSMSAGLAGIGFSLTIGSSTMVSLRYEKCNECEE